MQAPQRPVQRRSPASDSPGPPPTISARAISPSLGPQPRNSTASTKSVQSSHSGRRQNGGQAPTSSSSQSGQNPPPLSQIEKSVTHLLVATKQLLETLTQWSRHQATDAQVSDVYVRLGYEFNIACRAFTAINVDTSDLGNVPELLRHILESTLSQEASVESLEKYLPRIRDIIITLLHGLKRKQQKLRQKQGRDSVTQNGESIPRNGSFSSIASSSTGLTTLLNQGLENNFQGDSSGAANDRGSKVQSTSDSTIPPRMSSASGSNRRAAPPPRDSSRGSVSSDHSTISSTTMQNIPVVPPYPGDEVSVRINDGDHLTVDNFPPPPPPPKTNAALAALQRGGDLERRASRRYSAYQISKLVGASPNGVPMLPVPQNSPIPNRGRNDARESLRAVQNRDQRHGRTNSRLVQNETSPVRKPSMIAEESSETSFQQPEEPVLNDIPTVKIPDDKSRQSIIDYDGPSATLNGPPSDTLPSFDNQNQVEDKAVSEPPQAPEHKKSTTKRESTTYDSQARQFTPEESPPPPDKEITVFLQYKTKVKKFVLADGYKDLSMARLQLAFIEKFAWNTHNNGVDLPEIYIQDPVSGVRHELEDLHDIKDRSVLVLNVEVLDEVKRHIDDSLGGLKKMVESVKTAVDDQQVTIQRVSDRQQDAAKEMARIASAPPGSSRLSMIDTGRLTNGNNSSPSKVNGQAQLSEIQSLRRDLAVLRQTYSGFQSDIQSSMALIRTKASSVKSVAVKAVIPNINGDSGRSYVNSGKKNLSEDSDKLVAQVDDLQDIVEDLRKDVVQRGVRPLPKQLETVAKDISQATMELKKMQDFLKRERPIWTKIWEKELETVCNDREEITMQEDLAADLQDDLEKAAQTFALVEQATKEQLKDGSPSQVGTGRNLSKALNRIDPIDPATAKEGVLGEVRALQPNHENRLEAIERAEKLRQKELESRRGNELQKELTTFVEEGKLKKSGGFEEVERQRIAKDARIRKEVWERQNGMTQADADLEIIDDPEVEEVAEEDEMVEDDAEADPEMET
ncbi:Bud site selection protein 6 [Ciborinia camelliae]|nr:Bud site selection protein 6 [Ciborinia camelliae]